MEILKGINVTRKRIAKIINIVKHQEIMMGIDLIADNMSAENNIT